MSVPIVYIDTSEIRPGRLAELRTAMAELTDYVEASEPRLLAYHVYFNHEGTRMTVVHVNPDTAALQFHLDAAGPQFTAIGKFIDLQAIDVYCKLDDATTNRLHAKANALGCGVVRVHDADLGFSRLPRR
jgi:quinol monooxygenase YgiN